MIFTTESTEIAPRKKRRKPFFTAETPR